MEADMSAAKNETKRIFLTKNDFVSGYDKGRYEYIDADAQKNINSCKRSTDVLAMDVTTGSGLKVMHAEKITAVSFSKFMGAK